MFSMSSAQLQSIKKTVNTYKVSFTRYTPNRNGEGEPWPAGSSLGRYSVRSGSSVSHPTGLTGQHLQGLSLTSAWCLHMFLVKKYWPQGTAQLKSQETLYRLFPLVYPLRPDPVIQTHPSIVPHIQVANTSRHPRQELKNFWQFLTLGSSLLVPVLFGDLLTLPLPYLLSGIPPSFLVLLVPWICLPLAP